LSSRKSEPRLGSIIAAFAVDCHFALIYVRGEFWLGYRVMEKALDEARASEARIRRQIRNSQSCYGLGAGGGSVLASTTDWNPCRP
jgi:NADH:ubiquinone oxidoreductase subunit F (NADH-binding)